MTWRAGHTTRQRLEVLGDLTIAAAAASAAVGHTRGKRRELAGTQGFEPRLDGPEPPVLPLNDVPATVAPSIIAKGECGGQRRCRRRRASGRRSHRVELELLERGDLRQALARQRLGAGAGLEFQGLDQVLIGGGRLPKGAQLEQAGADMGALPSLMAREG